MNNRMKKSALLLFLFAAVACTDAALKEKELQLQQHLVAQQNQAKQINADLSSLQALVSKVADGFTVQTVAPVQKNGAVDNFLFTFNDGKTLSLTCGALQDEGVTGTTPDVSLRLDGECWYWTSAGNILKDGSGKDIPASGADGAVLKVKCENDQWQVSADKGTTWLQIPAHKAYFKGLVSQVNDTSNRDYILISLTNTRIIQIPKRHPLKLTFDPGEIRIAVPGQSASLGFSLTGGSDKNEVRAVGKEGWLGEVKMESPYKGSITVTAPDPVVEGEVELIAGDGYGYTAIATLDCFKGTVSVADDAHEVDAAGGTVTLNLTTDMDYTLGIGADWVSLSPSTKALRNETLSFTVAENTGGERTCRISLNVGGEEATYALIHQRSGLVIPSEICFQIEGMGTFSYDKTSHLVSVYTVGSSSWLRILSPEDVTVYELGPVPEDIKTGDRIEATFAKITAGTTVKEIPLSLLVDDYSSGLLKFQSSGSDYLVTRF